MKHLAQIQAEFIKHANWWSRLSQDEKRKYLMMHPGSNLPESGEDIEFEHPSRGHSHGTVVETMKNNLYKILDKLTGEHVLVPESALAV